MTSIIEWTNGIKEWYYEGELHRADGPSTEYSNGNKVWYKEGKLHRLDGPARIQDNKKEYWLFGHQLSKQKYLIKSTDQRSVDLMAP